MDPPVHLELLRLDPASLRIRSTTQAGEPFAAAGAAAWVNGNAGRGNGIVHVRLAARR